MEGEEILRVEKLIKRFGDFTALNGVSLSIGGGVTSIIGPNGAGKTTLINVITGRLKPDAGRVFFMGKDITRESPHKIVRMGIARTFQVVNLFGRLTVYQNVLIASLSRRGAGVDIEGIIERLGLSRYRDVEVSRLPHGLQRVVEVAVALATKPRLLFLDEPMAGLNVDEKMSFSKLVRELAREMPIVLVEHDMDVVFDLSERIIVMNRGKVIADGSPSEIANNSVVREIYLGV